jgi:hypothetical protein
MLLAESGTNRRQKICKQESFNQIRMLNTKFNGIKATYPHFIYEQTVSSSRVLKNLFFHQSFILYSAFKVTGMAHSIFY